MGLIKFLANIFKKKKSDRLNLVYEEVIYKSDSAEHKTEIVKNDRTESEPLTFSKSDKLIIGKINQKRKYLNKAVENSRNFHNLLDDRIQDEPNAKISNLFEAEDKKQLAKIKDYNNQLAISDKDAYQGIVDKATIAQLDQFIAIAKSLKKNIKGNINPTVKKFVGKLDISIVSTDIVKLNIKNQLLEENSKQYNDFVEEIENNSEDTNAKQISFLKD